MIRVGRRIYSNGGYQDPEYPGFTKILVMTPGYGGYHTLSPYSLKNDKGQIMENIWQFSKVYYQVRRSVQRKSRYDNTIIWNHPAEIHVVESGEITDEYVAWREKGFNNPYPVRYPNGYNYRHECVCSLKTIYDQPLDYIESRKQIYLPLYIELVSQQDQFFELKELLSKGMNLLIIEVDGPHEESMSYYIKKYGVSTDFIELNTMLANEDNLRIMLNDPKHPFGHGYCLAVALLELDLS